MSEVPTIDLMAIDEAALAAIDRACRDHGFFLVRNHGLEEVTKEMWEESERFFAAPYEEKAAVKRSEDYPIGYYDRELTKRVRDQKEVFDFFVEPEGMEPFVRWPANRPRFRDVLSRYHIANADLARRLTQLVCEALGVGAHALDYTFEDGHSSITRLNHYPYEDPLPVDESAEVTPLGDMALHHHTDTGLITLLTQDSVGGLQALSASDGWIDVPPQGGTIVINISDMMQVWSNDVYKSAVHRVTPRRTDTSRYSTPFFFQPANKTIIEPLEGLGEPKFRPFAWREFIDGRVADNYGDTGEEDIQIDRYRIA